LERYVEATQSVDSAQPALIVWPESALQDDLEREPQARTRLRRLVEDRATPLLTGATGSAIAEDGTTLSFNSVHFLRPRHGMSSYHKRLLVPFAEVWPVFFGASPIDTIAAGSEVAIFGSGALAFGPLICFEITDAPSARTLARRGARFIVNVNNDIWFRGWEAPHFVWARVRAVESGLPVVRATNSGTSAIIDGFGRVLSFARTVEGPEFLLGSVPPPVETLYARTGELFLPACVLIIVIGLLRRTRITGTALRDRRVRP
jgi:apolipoprotein N-acyltransferase